MIQQPRIGLVAALALGVACAAIVPACAADKKAAGAPLTLGQSTLIDHAIARERQIIQLVRQRAPLVETYIQNMTPDPVYREVPASDQHFLGRVNFNKVIGDKPFEEGPRPGQGHGLLAHLKPAAGSFTGDLTSGLHLKFQQGGFVQMLLIDSNSFDRQHYTFTFVRSDFLGAIPTDVFDVSPATRNAQGRFLGRIWIETAGASIVRFNGDFAGGEKDHAEFYHFDSWRTNVQPDLWLPTSFYVDQRDPKSPTSTLKFKSVSNVWGYALKLPREAAAQTELTVVGATDVSSDAPDTSPPRRPARLYQTSRRQCHRAPLHRRPARRAERLRQDPRGSRKQHPCLQPGPDPDAHPRAHAAHRSA